MKLLRQVVETPILRLMIFAAVSFINLRDCAAQQNGIIGHAPSDMLFLLLDGRPILGSVYTTKDFADYDKWESYEDGLKRTFLPIDVQIESEFFALGDTIALTGDLVFKSYIFHAQLDEVVLQRCKSPHQWTSRDGWQMDAETQKRIKTKILKDKDFLSRKYAIHKDLLPRRIAARSSHEHVFVFEGDQLKFELGGSVDHTTDEHVDRSQYHILQDILALDSMGAMEPIARDPPDQEKYELAGEITVLSRMILLVVPTLEIEKVHFKATDWQSRFSTETVYRISSKDQKKLLTLAEQANCVSRFPSQYYKQSPLVKDERIPLLMDSSRYWSE